MWGSPGCSRAEAVSGSVGEGKKGVLSRLRKSGEGPGEGSDGLFFSPRLGVPSDSIDGAHDLVAGGTEQKF